MNRLFGDLALARQIEEYAAIDDAAYIKAMKQLNPKGKFEFFEFSSGRSCYAGNSPFSNTHGFGTNSDEHNEKCLREIEQFFLTNSCPSIFSVASVSENSCLKLLYDNGYSPVGFRNVYIHTERSKNLSISTESIHIKEVAAKEELNTWLFTVSNGFAGKELDKPDSISLGQSIKKGNRFFLAYFNGKVAGGSALYLNGKFARLGGMTTLPEFQGRGIQQAMIDFRVNFAKESGSEIISSDTNPGNNSQRNLERLGFKLAYVRGIYRKSPS